MNYGFKPRIMWTVFKGSFKKQTALNSKLYQAEKERIPTRGNLY